MSLDPTRGFLRFVLDVSPSKQFLKVGSPDNTLLTSCYDGGEEADTVVFPKAVTTLYLGYIQLTSIQPFTFKGVASTV